jgi:anti-sigma factor RsiW
MNEPLPNCEPWHEAISLLAAGCLPADEETGVRQHLAGCAACEARFAELTTVCVTLSRSRPSAIVPAAAIRSRWSEAADRVTIRRPAPSVPWRVLWLSGALAASLLIAVLWLANRQPGGSPTIPHEPRVAEGGSQSAADQPPLPPQLPPPSPPAKAPPERVRSQPTLRDYQVALAQSDEAFEALLERHGESIVFEPYNPESLLKESSR